MAGQPKAGNFYATPACCSHCTGVAAALASKCRYGARQNFLATPELLRRSAVRPAQGVALVVPHKSEGMLTGLVSEKDLLAATASAERWQKPLSTVMRSNVICYEEETPIHVVYEFLCRVSLRGVIITKDGQPTGVVNRTRYCVASTSGAPTEARSRRRFRFVLRPDIARQTRHLRQSSATRTAPWQAGRRDKVVLLMFGTARAVAAPSAGDGVDRAAADPQSFGDFTLREASFPQHATDFLNQCRGNHHPRPPKSRPARAPVPVRLHPTQRHPMDRRWLSHGSSTWPLPSCGSNRRQTSIYCT